MTQEQQQELSGIFTFETVLNTLQAYIDKCEKIPKEFRSESLNEYYSELKSLRTKLKDKRMTHIQVFGELGVLNLSIMLNAQQRQIDYTKQVVPNYPEGGYFVGENKGAEVIQIGEREISVGAMQGIKYKDAPLNEALHKVEEHYADLFKKTFITQK